MMGGAGNLNIHSDLLMKKDERDSFAAKGVAALAWRDRLRNSVSLGIECGGAVGNKANENGENASKSHNGNCRRFLSIIQWTERLLPGFGENFQTRAAKKSFAIGFHGTGMVCEEQKLAGIAD